MTEDPWGPYRQALAHRLASCADYLGRLQRSLDGEAAPNRHYFSMRAHDLFEAARDLVRLTQEVEHWLIVCNEYVLRPDGTPLERRVNCRAITTEAMTTSRRPRSPSKSATALAS